MLEQRLTMEVVHVDQKSRVERVPSHLISPTFLEPVHLEKFLLIGYGDRFG